MKKSASKALFLITLLSGHNAMAFDLQDTMVSAYQYNNQLKAQQKQLLSTQEEVPLAYSEFMPQAAFDGSLRWGKTNNLLTEEFGGNLYNHDHSHDFIVAQPLFNGGQSIERVNRAYNNVAAATSDLQTTEEQVLINAITAHMDVVKSKEVLELSKDNDNVLKEQLDAANQRFQLGEATKTDVAQAQSRYSRAISDRVRAEGDLIAALATYKSITGAATEQLIDNPLNFTMPQVDVVLPETLESAVDQAFNNNPVLSSQIFREKASENDVSIAYGALSPSLSLRGTLSRDTDTFSQPVNLGSDDIKDNEENIILSLSVPLYQGGAEYARIRQAKKTRESLKFQIQQRKDQLRSNVVKAWEDIVTSHATIKATNDAVLSATNALSGVKQEQAVGARTVLDVLDAEQELYQGKVNLVNAQRNEIVAVYNLKFHLGELTAKRLQLPVKTFDDEKHMDNTEFKMIGF